MTYTDHQTAVEAALRSRGVHLAIRTIESLSTRLRAEFREQFQFGKTPADVANQVYNHLCRLRLED